MRAMASKSYDWDSSKSEGESPNPTPLPHMRLWFDQLLKIVDDPFVSAAAHTPAPPKLQAGSEPPEHTPTALNTCRQSVATNPVQQQVHGGTGPRAS